MLSHNEPGSLTLGALKEANRVSFQRACPSFRSDHAAQGGWTAQATPAEAVPVTFPTLAKGSTHCSQLPGPFPQLGTGPYPGLARSGLWEEVGVLIVSTETKTQRRISTQGWGLGCGEGAGN